MRYCPLVFLFSCLFLSSDLNGSPTVSYTALSDAAKKAGQIKLYENVPFKSDSIIIGNHELKFKVPAKARAYDIIPITFTLSSPVSNRKSAVSATAYEDISKSGDEAYYDMSIPGNLSVNMEYLGSVGADYLDDIYVPLTPDGKSPPSPFPPIKREPMVRSSTIKQAQMVWHKIKITNTGNTILDPEGFGASFIAPYMVRLDENGKEEWRSQAVNLYYRHLNYIYPGESYTTWINLWSPQLERYQWGLTEGSYLISFQMLYRDNRDWNWIRNIWGGSEFARLDVPIKVTKEGGFTKISETFKITDTSEKMPGYIDTFEEFMTSFKIFKPSETRRTIEDTIYLQAAPWTKKIVVKLMLTDPQEIAVVKIPIDITTETLDIKYNPNNPMVINRNGKDEPVITVQAMPGMRTGFQLGPYAERYLRSEINEMESLGINLIANTSGGWWLPELTGRKEAEAISSQYKYWYDDLMRKSGMKLQGWSVYPPSGENWYTHAAPLFKDELKYAKTLGIGYTQCVDMGDPIVPKVIAAWVKFNYSRWGNMWFTTKDGRTPIDIEDTWGWLRDDINARHHPGSLALDQFRKWVKKKYISLDNLNSKWGSDYKSFDEIDPNANQGIEGDGINHGLAVYNKPENVFHDWSVAAEDWDVFRTELRMDILKKSMEIIRKTIPNAEWCIRSEGSNLIIKSNPKSDNMHWRHVYYSQRRNAVIYDVVKKSKAIGFYSDYTTIPHSEYEWREAMRQMTNAGITPAFLPQFDHMRDILLNPYYGRDYKIPYNLNESTKGMMIHCLTAAYPWWKATYEEGGAPGLLWSDYLCDGFATETQKREIRLLRDNFDKMKK